MFFFFTDAILYFPITFKCLESKNQQKENSKEVPHSFTECLLTTTEGREGAEKTDSGIKFRPVSITVVTGLTGSERWKGNARTTWGRRLWYTWEERVYVFGLREHGELSLKEKKKKKKSGVIQQRVRHFKEMCDSDNNCLWLLTLKSHTGLYLTLSGGTTEAWMRPPHRTDRWKTSLVTNHRAEP